MNLLQKIGTWIFNAGGGKVTPTSDAGWTGDVDTPGKPSFSTLVDRGYRSNPWVYTCVQRRATTIAGLPWRAIEVDSNEELATVHGPGSAPYDFLFSTTTMPFRKAMNVMTTQLDIGGEAYPLRFTGEINSNGEIDNTKGTPRSWLPIAPSMITPKGNRLGQIKEFEFTDSGGDQKSYTPDEMAQISYPDPEDYLKGVSPLEAAYQSTVTNNSAEEWMSNILSRGEIPAVAWQSIYEDLSNDQINDQWDMLMQSLRHTRKGKSLHILASMFKPELLAMKPMEMDLGGSQKDARRAICAAFGVPLPIAGDMDEATYSNFDQAVMVHIKRCLDTARMVADVFNFWVAPQFTPFTRFDIDTEPIEELQEDVDKKADRERADVLAGIALRNEVREERGLDPVPGGDIPTVDNGQIPLDEATLEDNATRTNPITEE